MLRNLLTDTHGRPMMPTYATKSSRRYAYYETRKDLAKATDAPATRWPRARLEKHLINHLLELLNDEHALRRLAGLTDAGQLNAMFKAAQPMRDGLRDNETLGPIIDKLVASIQCGDAKMELQLNAQALDLRTSEPLSWSIPLPSRKPFREAKLRIDEANDGRKPDQQLVQVLVDAMDVQVLVLASPELSLNQLGKREGRCRKQLTKLLRLSWVSPRIVEAILSGEQPRQVTRAQLLNSNLPLEWEEQERLLGSVR